MVCPSQQYLASLLGERSPQVLEKQKVNKVQISDVGPECPARFCDAFEHVDDRPARFVLLACSLEHGVCKRVARQRDGAEAVHATEFAGQIAQQVATHVDMLQ